MEPINATARRSSFLSFLLLQIIIAVFITAIVFIGSRMPFREAQQLKAQNDASSRERIFTSDFGQKMRQVKVLLDSAEIAGPQTPIVENKIDNQIKQMSSDIDQQTTADKYVYQGMTERLLELKVAKSRIRELSKNNAAAAECLNKIERLEAAKATLESQLAMYRSDGANGNKSRP